MQKTFIQIVNGYRIYRDLTDTPIYKAYNENKQVVASGAFLDKLVIQVSTLKPATQMFISLPVWVCDEDLERFQIAVRNCDGKVLAVHEKENALDIGVFVDVAVCSYTCLYIIGQMTQNLKELV